MQIDWANEYVNLQVVSKEQKCNWMPIFEYKLLRFQLHFEFDSVWHYRFEKGPIESSLQSKIFGFFLLSFPQNERKIYLSLVLLFISNLTNEKKDKALVCLS